MHAIAAVLGCLETLNGPGIEASIQQNFPEPCSSARRAYDLASLQRVLNRPGRRHRPEASGNEDLRSRSRLNEPKRNPPAIAGGLRFGSLGVPSRSALSLLGLRVVLLLRFDQEVIRRLLFGRSRIALGTANGRGGFSAASDHKSDGEKEQGQPAWNSFHEASRWKCQCVSTLERIADPHTRWRRVGIGVYAAQ
jgi:hypothetical protein